MNRIYEASFAGSEVRDNRMISRPGGLLYRTMAGNMETYHGHVSNSHDAILIFEACRLGILNRVQRRLSDQERKQIRSGSIFVWEESEAGMQRWTDSKIWGPSRVSGPFLMYREMETRNSSSGGASSATSGPSSSSPAPGQRTPTSESALNMERYSEVPGGLIKQSYSLVVTSTGSRLHLICYYSSVPGAPHGLRQPSHDPALNQIVIPLGLYPEPALASNEVGSRSQQQGRSRPNTGTGSMYSSGLGGMAPIAIPFQLSDKSLPPDMQLQNLAERPPIDPYYRTALPFGSGSGSLPLLGTQYQTGQGAYSFGSVRSVDLSLTGPSSPVGLPPTPPNPFGIAANNPYLSQQHQRELKRGTDSMGPRSMASMSQGTTPHVLPAVNHLISSIEQDHHRASTPVLHNADAIARVRISDNEALRRLDRNFR